MRTLFSLTSKFTKAVSLTFAGILLTTAFTIVESTPASAVNPVGSIFFNYNGSLQYSLPSAPGSQNTTIEFWMKQTGTGNLQRIYTTSWSFAANNITIRASGNGCIDANVANNSLQKPGGTDYSCPSINVWHHIALVGLGTTWKFYVDGNLALTRSTWTLTSGWADPTKPNITDSAAFLGGWGNSERFAGYISNFREVIGTAVYTSNFTPVNPPLEATQSSGSSGISAVASGQTKLLLNTLYDGTLATAQADTSGNALTPTLYGTPVASNQTPVLTATSITNFTIPALTYGASATMSATSSVAGTITFLANGSAIVGCSNISENVSNIATCTFTPTTTSSVAYTLNFTPTSTGYASLTGVNSTSVTATKASLSVQPSPSSVAYGGTPSYALSYSGFVNNETTTSPSFTTGLNPPTCSATSFTTSTSVSSSPLSITCSGGSSTNYSFTYASTANLTITQATPTVSLALSAATPTYGAIDTITATASIPGVVTFKLAAAAITGCDSVATSVSSPYTAQCQWIPVSASTAFSLSASLAPTNTVDYTSANSGTTTTPSSNRAAITVTPTAGQSKIYGASDPIITYSITTGSLVGSDQLTGALTYASAGQTTAPGSYAISSGTLTNANNPNYTIALALVNFAITKATTTTTLVASHASASYGTTIYDTATVTPSGATGTISFANDGTPITGCSSVNVVGGLAVCSSWKPSAGTYGLITATYSGDSNYLTSVDSQSISLEITKATLIVTPDSKNIVYGSSVPTYTFTYQGFVNGESASSSSFTTGLTAPVCTNATYSTSTSVGDSPLTISCSGGVSTNYSFNTSATASLTVSKATTSLSLALANATPTYGSVDTITATASVPGTVTFKSSGINIPGCENLATSGSSTVTAQCAWIPGAVTSYSLTAVLAPANSVDFSSVTATALTPTSVKPAITVTPTAGQSKVYLSNNPTLTYSITSGALVGSDVLTGTLTYTGTLVGDYAITIGTLANPNYTITLASATFAITKATQTAVTLSSLSTAYNPSNKTVSLTGDGGTGTGGYTYALDSSNTTTGCSVSGSNLTYTTAGTCVVAVTRTLDTNYFARTDIVSFSIGLASQTITFVSLSAKNYSSDTFTVSATSSASLTVRFTSASQSVCTTSGSYGGTITLLGVGTCVINANQAGDSNVAAATQVSQNFTVNPRAITVRADSKTKSYGASDPTFTYSITTGSLLLGDALTGSLSRDAGTDAGTYQIQQGALTTANNPKYAITFVAADLTINRATPTLVLTYPNSNVAILRPGATDTPTVTTSSSSGSLTFATTAASSICTVHSTSGVISLFGAGSCPVAMTTAQTTNYIQYTETTTVTVALLSTSLTGINQSNLISMGQTFFAHSIIDQSYSFSSGSNGASVAIPAGALDASVPISIHLLADSTDQRAIIGGTGTSVLSVVVSWVASDGSVPNTNTGKAISVTLTNPAIKSGAKVYSIIGSQSQLLGTATADGSITTLITEDPVLLVINPVVTTTAPTSSSGGSGGGGGYVMAVVVDNSAAIEAANLKLAADKAAAELKAAQEKKAAEEEEAAAVKAAKELADAQAQAAAELKASQDKAAQELRIAEELRLAQLKAEADLKTAAEKKALADFATAARNATGAVTLYSVSPSLKLNSYDSAYLAKYVKSLKSGAAVTCIGYAYGKSPATKASQTLAKRQATAVCSQMKTINKSLKTSIVIYPATKAPKAAVGAKWVAVSYRIDGFKK